MVLLALPLLRLPVLMLPLLRLLMHAHRLRWQLAGRCRSCRASLQTPPVLAAPQQHSASSWPLLPLRVAAAEEEELAEATAAAATVSQAPAISSGRG